MSAPDPASESAAEPAAESLAVTPEASKRKRSAAHPHPEYSDLRQSIAVIDPLPGARGPLWLRPFGYLLLAVIWGALFLVAFVMSVPTLPLAIQGIAADNDGLFNSPGFQGPGWQFGFGFAMLLLVLFLGMATIMLNCWTLGHALTLAALFARSLNPKYANEQLSFSSWSRGESVGGVSTAFTGTTISGLPLRVTRWTKLTCILWFNGWIPNLNAFVLGIGWSVTYLWTVGWIALPATGIGVPVCLTISVLLFLVWLWMIWRRRAKLVEIMPGVLEKTPYAYSWPNDPSAARRNAAKKKPARKK